MTPSMNINKAVNGLDRKTSNTLSVSASPEAGRFGTSPETPFPARYSTSHDHRPSLPRKDTAIAAKQLKPFETGDIKILLLENINQVGQDVLRDQGYQVEATKASLPEHELIDKIK